MEYQIVEAVSVKRLAEKVNEKLKQGWTVQGSPFTTQGESEGHQHGITIFCQAMTKDQSYHTGGMWAPR